MAFLFGRKKTTRKLRKKSKGKSKGKKSVRQSKKTQRVKVGGVIIL